MHTCSRWKTYDTFEKNAVVNFYLESFSLYQLIWTSYSLFISPCILISIHLFVLPKTASQDKALYHDSIWVNDWWLMFRFDIIWPKFFEPEVSSLLPDCDTIIPDFSSRSISNFLAVFFFQRLRLLCFSSICPSNGCKLEMKTVSSSRNLQPSFDQLRRAFWQGAHSDCPSVPVRECGKRDLHHSLWPPPKKLRGVLHLVRPDWSPNLFFATFARSLAKSCRNLYTSNAPITVLTWWLLFA